MALFDINKLKGSGSPVNESSKDRILATKFLDQHNQKIKSLKELRSAPPGPGIAYFLWTENSFNAFTFLPYLIKEHDKIEELYISTYSINARILQSFMQLMQKEVLHKVHILVSDSLRHRVPKVYDQLLLARDAHPEALSVCFAWNHSKIALARCGENHYCMEGSGNWSENSRHEQYIFCNSEELFNFRKSCILDILTNNL